jgi:ubiquinone/menaquinone biosynthesis C-methylase UbiE
MQVDYDQVAATYNRRYQANSLPGVSHTLRSLVQDLPASSVLEVGCGTGRWLEELQEVTAQIFGIDLSPGMLHKAQERDGRFGLVCGQAWQLPFIHTTFDLIFCVHAFHHFEHKEAFIGEAYRRLRPGGALSIIGMDPHSGRDCYYLYEYFEGTLRTDLKRFPPAQTIEAWMHQAGFDTVRHATADWIRESFSGDEIWADPFLAKEATSQLTLLSQQTYQEGLERMRLAIQRAHQRGEEITFKADIEVTMITASRRK